MKLKKISFNDSEKVWRELYGSIGHITVYMSYDFQKIYHKYFRSSKNRYMLSREIYAATNNGDEILCILPFCRRGRHYWISGDFCATGSLDFIYGAQFTDSDFNELFETVRAEFHKGAVLHLNKINESSRLNAWLMKNFEPVKKEICVNIPLTNDYDQYLSNLSKHHRHLINNAKNRISRDNRQWRIEVKFGGNMDDKQFNEMMSLYNKREGERKRRGISPIVPLVRNNFNPITVSFKELSNSIIFFLYIEDKLAGFISGYITDGTHDIVAPRLAIESGFSYYSPGYLLISETIRYLIENTEIRNLDLSRGDEEYKYRLGGVTHHNYSYELNLP